MSEFFLSKEADEDFKRLFEFGINNFGIAKATSYSNGLKERFDEIVQYPYHWQSVEYIRTSYRRSVYRNHSIYYIIENEKNIRIVRILGKENVKSSLT